MESTDVYLRLFRGIHLGQSDQIVDGAAVVTAGRGTLILWENDVYLTLGDAVYYDSKHGCIDVSANTVNWIVYLERNRKDKLSDPQERLYAQGSSRCVPLYSSYGGDDGGSGEHCVVRDVVEVRQCERKRCRERFAINKVASR